MVVQLSKITMSLKEVKTKFIVDVATDLFLRSSISSVTIKDISIAADVGEATVYRYFVNKENIIIACINKLMEMVARDYFKLSQGKTGYEKLSIFYNSFLDVFKDNPDFYFFLKEFDAYIYAQHVKDLKAYERDISQYKAYFINAYELGLQDGSVKEIKNIDVFYFASSHSLLELCKKLSLKRALLTQDKSIKKVAEIQCLVRLILQSLKA